MSSADITRVSAKFWVDDPSSVSATASEYIAVFHRWIQESTVEGLLIDVADYGHVPNGPGVILIGHDADRALDLLGGPGFRYEGKRGRRPAVDQLVEALAGAATGAAVLTADPALDGVAFDAAAVRVAVADRIALSNDDAGLEAIAPAIADAVAQVFPDVTAEPTRVGDSRGPLTVDLTFSAPVALPAPVQSA